MSSDLHRSDLHKSDPVRSDLTDDAILGGRLKILQPRTGHRVGHDAILLAAATPAKSGDHAVDLGAGVGAAGLALAVRVDGVTVKLVEIDSGLVALAHDNAARNGLADRVSAIACDVASLARFRAEWKRSVDHVLMNPPFNDPTRQHVSPDPRRRNAHAAPRETLNAWVAAAGELLRDGASLALIYRADGLGDVLAALDTGFGAIAVLPIYPKPNAPAIRVLVRAIKASRAPMSVTPGLLLNGDDGRPTTEAEAVLRRAASLLFAAD
jgi:tRNA1(Val) A37 N6-methylase TrmN6